MKYMNMKKKYRSLDLQLFAGEGGDGGSDGEGSEGDDEGGGDPDDEGDDDPDEKKFSQKDIDEAVKKRIARERRKWQREQQKDKPKPDGGDDAGKGGEESEDSRKRKEAEAKASSLEVKVACFEAGVAKDSVADVAALARSYMEADEDLDLEDAIEKVVKKYPQFKKGSGDPYEEETDTKGSWGQRQSGKGSKKVSGVEAAFLKKNPGLKID